jgi:tRNA nucleotidyltransferase/poly(A) polymerase
MRKAARRIVEKLRLHGHEAFFAGGWVRDFLLRRRPKDIDIATSAMPDEVRRLFPNSRSIGAQFGVIQVPLYGHFYEVATFRSDNTYLDGRHPSSVTFSGPEQDALRRDFTINGLFYDPIADRLIDYVHGRSDIQSKLIRTIGKPAERFAEDKLRMLRAIRFACNLGFTIVPETWDAIRRLASDILQVSWERIRDELTAILTGPSPASGIHFLYDSGLLTWILPEVAAMHGISQPAGERGETDPFTRAADSLALLRRPSLTLAFGTLLRDTGAVKTSITPEEAPGRNNAEQSAAIAEAVCRRLRISNEEIGRIVSLVLHHTDFSRIHDMRESALKKFLWRPDIDEQLELYRVDRLSSRGDLELYEYCRQKIQEFAGETIPAPLITGEDLIAMGYSPGPIFKKILEDIENLQLEGALHTREEALFHVRTAFPPTITTT